MLMDTLGTGLLAPFELVYALRVPHLPLATAGLILSVAAAGGMGAGPLAGAMADRLGPARVAALANGLGAGGCASLVVWTNPWGYGLGALLLSAAQRAFWGTFTPLVTTAAEEKDLELWFSRLRGTRYIGLVAGEALSGFVLLAGQQAGLRLIVIADGVSFVAAAGLILRAAGAVQPAPPPAEPGARGYRAVLADRTNLVLAGLNVGATLLIVAPFLALPVVILDDLHLPAWLPGLLAGVITAVTAGGLLVGSRLVEGRRRLRNLQIANLLWVLALGIFLLAPAGKIAAYVALLVGAALLGFGEVFYAPTADALPAALAPPALRGRYAALHQLAWGISDTLAPTLVAAALSVGSTFLWSLLAVLAAGSAAAYRSLEGIVAGRDGVAGR